MIKMKIDFSIHDGEDFILLFRVCKIDSFNHEDLKCTDFILFTVAIKIIQQATRMFLFS